MSAQPAPATQAAPPRRKGLERFRVQVLDAQRPSESLVLLRFDRPAGYAFEAGQFAYVFLPDGEEKRAYSIASPPHFADRLEFAVKKVDEGPGSSYLYGLRRGETVEISRALGGFKFRSPEGMPVVFLATGTGVAPFRAMVLDRLERRDPRDVWLFEGSREIENLPYHRDFSLLATRHRKFRYVPVLSKAPLLWEGDRGWVQEAYLKRFYHARPHHAYICGVRRMVDDVRLLLQERGLPTDAIHVERYD